jgi:ribosomal protein L34E
MVEPKKRRQKYKHKKTMSGTKREYFDGKNKKLKCAITGKNLHGVPHTTTSNARKHSKTEKRPSAPFGGILSGKAREQVFIELAKVIAGIKKINDVDGKYREYVKQGMNRAKNE